MESRDPLALSCRDRRRANTRHLLKKRRLTQREFARLMGKSPSFISDLVGKNPEKNIGHGLAREIEQKLGLPENWLDQDHSLEPLGGISRIIDAADYLIEENGQEILVLEKPVRTAVLRQYFEQAIEHGVSRDTLSGLIRKIASF